MIFLKDQHDFFFDKIYQDKFEIFKKSKIEKVCYIFKSTRNTLITA